MYCSKIFEALDKRLEEKKTLDEIGRELCDTVTDPRGKTIRLIKADKGEEYLIENADWLGYDVNHIRNAEGENRPKNFGQLETSSINVTTKPGEIAMMLIAENSLPDGKGIALHGLTEYEGHNLWLRIEPCKQKGFHYMILIDFGSGEDSNDAYMDFTKRGLNDAWLDYAFKRVYRWTPLGCSWEWTALIVDRLQENPVWSHATKIASWKKKACCDGR